MIIFIKSFGIIRNLYITKFKLNTKIQLLYQLKQIWSINLNKSSYWYRKQQQLKLLEQSHDYWFKKSYWFKTENFFMKSWYLRFYWRYRVRKRRLLNYQLRKKYLIYPFRNLLWIPNYLEIDYWTLRIGLLATPKLQHIFFTFMRVSELFELISFFKGRGF